MIRRAFPTLAALVLAGVAVTAVGCRTSAPTRFYVLTPLAELDASRPTAPPRAPLNVGVRRVTLPEYLDRPQIVTRIGPSQLAISDFDRWAGPLADEFPRVLALNLGAVLPSNNVVVFPWPRGAPVDYEVSVEVTQFEGRAGGECALVARWTIYARQQKHR
jgi:uncharacterized lipoprotein YmbA